jgi:hypothetical protein
MKTKLVILGAVLVLAPAALMTAWPKKGGPAQTAAAQQAPKKYTCPMHPQYTAEKPGECPICGMNLVPADAPAPAPSSAPAAGQPPKKKIMYRSTMNPNEVSDKPGKDSMGMEMEPFEVEETPQGPAVEGLAPVRVSPEQRQLIGLATVTVKRRTVAKTIRTSGRVAYDPDLYYAEQEYLGALTAAAQVPGAADAGVASGAASLVESARMKLKLMGLGDEQIRALEQAGTPDSSLLLAKGNRDVWVYAAVYASDLAQVKAGQRAVITAPSVTDATYEGTIAAVDPVLDPQTRSARARIPVANAGGVLRPEVYVTVEISIPLGTGLVVPADAVIDTGTRKVVFVDTGTGVLEPREVQAGTRTDDLYLLKGGVVAGEKVVTNANFLIDSESQLKASMQKAAGGGHVH